MKLTQNETYRSIKSLPEVELPDFSLITGINGSGKTHLLEAIRRGNIRLDNLNPRDDGIQYFNVSSLLSQIESRSPTGLREADPKRKRGEAIDYLTKAIEQHRSHVARWFKNNHITGPDELEELSWLMSVTSDDLSKLLIESCLRSKQPIKEPLASNFAQNFISQRANWENSTLNNAQQFGELSSIIKEHCRSTGTSVLCMSSEQIRDALPLLWNPSDKLSLRFSEWFALYHIAWERNRMYRYYAESLGEEHSWLTDEEFTKSYGLKPWEMANDIFESCGAPYRFQAPKFAVGSEDDYVLSINTSIHPEVKLEMADLSSGEKLLLSIISFLYRASGTKTLARLPKVLLLDEIDSPLHPRFTHQLLKILRESIVENCKIKVLLVTHSPSTVALAPEGSIFELQKNPRCLLNVSRARAIEELTSGFVSVLPSSRVVITESEDDARVLSSYFQALTVVSKVPTHPPLTFLPASTKGSRGDGGAQEVKKWTPKLDELFGELGFFGVIDKDNNNISSDRVKALLRHSIENYVTDPLTVITYLIKEGLTDIFDGCPISDMNFRRLLTLQHDEIQLLVSQWCNYVEANTSQLPSTGSFGATYTNGITLTLPIWMRDTQGHILLNEIRRIANQLLASHRRTALFDASDPFRRPLEIQSMCVPEFVSQDFVTIFAEIQARNPT